MQVQNIHFAIIGNYGAIISDLSVDKAARWYLLCFNTVAPIILSCTDWTFGDSHPNLVSLSIFKSGT